MRTNKGVSKPRSVLVIAAHPDDEVLGCGGTIAQHGQRGDVVHVAFMGRGVASRGESSAEEIRNLQEQAHRANTRLGVASVRHFDFPDNRMDGVERLDVTRVIESLIGEYRPSVLYTHWAGDVNIDHRRVHDAAVTGAARTRALRGGTTVF